MAEYKVTDSELTALADKIRAKGGTEGGLVWLDGYLAAVDAIETEPPKVTSIDYSALESGTFSETLENGQTVIYTVTLDDSGQVSTITNGEHTTAVTWG